MAAQTWDLPNTLARRLYFNPVLTRLEPGYGNGSQLCSRLALAPIPR